MRHTSEDSGAYRLRVETTFPPNEDRPEPVVVVSYLGPWSSLAAAKGQRTSLRGEDARRASAFRRYRASVGAVSSPPRYTALTIEAAEQTWTEVTE